MKTFLLIVVFYNTFGQPTIIDGWQPLQVPTLERCEAGKANIENYISQSGLPESLLSFSVHCVEQEI